MRKFSPGVLLILFGLGAVLAGQRAVSEEPWAQDRDITKASLAISTSGTLTINAAVSFTATATSTTGAALTYAWNFGDGLPAVPGSKATASHTYAFPGTYTVTATISEAGNPNPTVVSATAVITDAVKSAKLQAWLDYTKPGNDRLKLTGVLRLPAGDASKHTTLNFDIGGLLCGLTLDGKGNGTVTSNANVVSGTTQPATRCDGSFKIWIKKAPNGTPYEDDPFLLILKKGTFQPAWMDEFVFNRNAFRETVRIATKITVLNIPGMVTSNANATNLLYTTTVTPTFNSTQNKRGVLR